MSTSTAPTAVRGRSRASTSSLKEYQDRLAGLPANKFIGSMLWYTVAGHERAQSGRKTSTAVRVHQDLLAEWFLELGIDERFLPPQIKKIDAFRNASSSVRREYEVPESNSTRFATLSVEEVKSDAEQVIRHVVRIIRDAKKEQLSLEHMATIKFIRGGRTSKGKRHGGDHIRYQVLTRVQGDDRDRVEQLISDFHDRYEDLSSHLHAPALRGIVRAILTSLNAIPMKASGGLYFVHKNRWPELDALKALITRFGPGCKLEDMAFLDIVDNRTMLTEALEDEVEDDCTKLLEAIAHVNASAKGGKIPGRKYAEINASYQEVATRTEEQGQLLGLAQGRAANALEMALAAVLEMAQRVDPGRSLR